MPDQTQGPVYASLAQVTAVLAILTEAGALPRGVSSRRADLESFARQIAEAVLAEK